MKLIAGLKKLVGSGNARTAKVKKNVLLAMIYRGLGIGIGFLTFSLSFQYLDPVLFGIFITLASVMDWIGYLDVGLGKGLRNKFGEALAHNDDSRGKAYVSTTFVVIGIAFSVLYIIFIIANNFIDWSAFLKVDEVGNDELRLLAIIVFSAFCLKFVFSNVYEVFNAMQRTAAIDFFNFLSKATFLVGLLVLISFADQSLLYFATVRSFAFAFVPVVVCFYYFRTHFKKYAPSLEYAQKQYVKELTSLGIKFFVIRISLLIINSTNNILITRLVGVEEVPIYNAAFRYMSVVIMAFTITTKPLWAAYIEAYQRGEFNWIKNIIKNMKKIWLGAIVLVSIMVALSGFIYKIWLGDEVHIPLELTALVAVSVLVTTWNQIFNQVINGTGKIQIQVIVTFISSLVNIPISIFLVRYFDLGTMGIVLGSIISLLFVAVISPIQVRKILNKKDVGIWGK